MYANNAFQQIKKCCTNMEEGGALRATNGSLNICIDT